MKEEKWGFDEPILFNDNTYGELFFKAYGTYEIQSKNLINIEEYINSNPNLIQQVSNLIIQNIIKEIYIQQQFGFLNLMSHINIDNVINYCNEQIFNTDIKITKISITSLSLTDESQAKVNNYLNNQNFNSINNSQTVVNSSIEESYVNNLNTNKKKNVKVPLILCIVIILSVAFIAGINFFKSDNKKSSITNTSNQNIVIKGVKFSASNIPIYDDKSEIVYLNIRGTFDYEIVNEKTFEEKYGKIEDDNVKDIFNDQFRMEVVHSVSVTINDMRTYSNILSSIKAGEFKNKVIENYIYNRDYIKITNFTILSFNTVE